MQQQQGSLLVLRNGSYSRTRLKAFRIHHEGGVAKDFGPEFRGEVFIEEDGDGVSLQVFKHMLEEAPQKNGKASAFMFGMYSVGLIIFGMAVHSMMLVRLLH
jgi:hypothetical protein